MEVALSQVQAKNRRLGQVLLGMSALKETVLNQTLVSQTRDILFSMLDWQDGDHVETDDVDFHNEVLFEMLYTPEIILQGMRRISNIVLLLRIRFQNKPKGAIFFGAELSLISLSYLPYPLRARAIPLSR
jgi:hypothetical protein